MRDDLGNDAILIASWGARLRREVDALGCPYGLERSLRISPGRVDDDRFLTSLSLASLGGNGLHRVAGLLSEMHSGAMVAAGLSRHGRAARFVHLGYEGEADRALLKFYIEFGNEAGATSNIVPGARLRHVGYKWNPDRNGDVIVTHYLERAARSGEQLLWEISENVGGQPALELSVAMIELARNRGPGLSFSVLDVVEPGGSRLSYDVNLYPFGLQVGDLVPAIGRCLEGFHISTEALAWFRERSRLPLGHFAAGLHRDGRPFVTLYYGLEKHVVSVRESSDERDRRPS